MLVLVPLLFLLFTDELDEVDWRGDGGKIIMVTDAACRSMSTHVTHSYSLSPSIRLDHLVQSEYYDV
jgi:hypothetical protein